MLKAVQELHHRPNIDERRLPEEHCLHVRNNEHELKS